MKRILRVKAGTTIDEIKRLTGATSVELVAEGNVANVELPDDAVGGVAKQVEDPQSPILDVEDDPEVSCENDYGSAFRHGFRDGFEYGRIAGRSVESNVAYVPTAWPAPVEEPPFADTEEWTWGLQAIGWPTTTEPRRGDGVKVCVADTGLHLEHPDFHGRQVRGRNFTGVGEPDDWGDRFGHGTHVAGTVCGAAATTPRPYGVAPGADLYVAKVLGDNGRGRMSSVLLAIEWAIANQVSVVNMSLSGGRNYRYLDEVGRRAIERGCLLVASAGNEGKDSSVKAPADSKWIMAVGALDRSLRSTGFSSPSGPDRDSAVDVSAPGLGVWSSSISGGYSSMSGTSMAAPHASGCACLWMERFRSQGMSPILQAAMTWQALLAYARRLPEPAAWVGAGVVQVPS